MVNILVLCTGNSCRSQMAHGYLAHFTNGQKVKVYSAGIETHGLNAGAVRTMLADGIDISSNTSNHISEYASVDFDYVITVCDHAKEHCPYFASKAKFLHHNFSDPAKQQGTTQELEEAFKKTREEIKAYCQQFVADYINPI
jgi:arsenate reductase (thioredoxin)